jgi:large subunit ribosomal protein L28
MSALLQRCIVSLLRFFLTNLCYTGRSLEINLSEVGRIMAMKCEYCGKGPNFGNVVSHANNTRRRRWNPNLKSVRALVSGARKRVKVCTACIRAGKVKKAA